MRRSERSPWSDLGVHDDRNAQVELVDARGATLTMRLGNGERLDVVGLASAFWHRRA
jgi:hypothetical protein